MTPIFCCGAECKIVTATGHWGSATGTVTADTGTVEPNGGAVSYKFQPGAGSAYLGNGIGGGAVLVVRFYFLIPTLPSAANTVGLWSLFVAGGGDGAAGVSVDENGHVLNSSGSQIGTVTANTWHYLDSKIDVHATDWTTSDALDGGAGVNGTITGAGADTIALFEWGHNSVYAGAGGVNWYGDHLVMSVTAGDYPIGSGQITGYTVNTTSGTHNQTAGDLKNDASTNITNGDGSGAKIQDLPGDTTSYIAQVVLRTTTYYEAVYNTSAATKAPRAVEQVVGYAMASAASGSHKAQLYDGTTATDAYALAATTNTARNEKTKQWASGPSGAWTAALFNTNLRIRWGFSGDITPNPRLTSTILEADFATVQSLTRTATEAPTTAESTARILAAQRTAAAAPTTSESVARTFAGLRTATAAPVLAESVGRTFAGLRTATAAPTTSEAGTRVLASVKTATDAPQTSDAATRLLTALRTATAAPTTSDSVTRLLVALRTVTGAPVTSDALTRVLAAIRTTADAPTLSDTAARILVALRTTTDAPTTSDVAMASRVFVRATTDAPVSAESVARLLAALRAAADAPLLSDVATDIGAYRRTSADAPMSSEVASRTASLGRTAADAPTTADSVAKSVSTFRTVVDAVASSEAVTRIVGIARSATDALSLSDLAEWLDVHGRGAGPVIVGALSAVARIFGFSTTATGTAAAGRPTGDARRHVPSVTGSNPTPRIDE